MWGKTSVAGRRQLLHNVNIAIWKNGFLLNLLYLLLLKSFRVSKKESEEQSLQHTTHKWQRTQ